MSLLQSLRAAGAAFPRARDGQVAIIFALSTIPMLLFIGTTVDYSRALTAQTNLQQATDATALAMIQKAAGLSSTALTAQSAAYLTAAAQDPTATISASSPLYTSATGKLCLNTASSVPTTFMNLAGFKTLNVQASSCAALGGGTFEVAMALDNTGSMATVDNVTGRSKIQSEVLAAQNLISTVFNGAATSPNYQVSIVPFTTSVNVGTQYNTAAWVDTQAKSSIAWENVPLPLASQKPKWTPTSRFDLFNQVSTAWGGCFEERPQPYTLSDTAPNPVYPNTLFEPMFAPDEGDTTSQGGVNRTNDNSYLSDSKGECTTTSENKLATTLDDAYRDIGTKTTGDGQGKYCKYKAQAASTRSAYGPNWGCDSTLQPLQLLTNTQSTLTATLAKMQANGNTNLVSGFLWGWRTISPNGPFENNGNIKPYNYTSPAGIPNNKFLVFMTDGYNNWQPDSNDPNGGVYSSFGYYANDRAGILPVTINGVTTNSYPNATNQRQYLDAAFLQACSNAKAAGVQVYTIGFSIPNDPIDQEGINTLSQCASQASMAYVATDGNQIVNIFGAIGTQLGKVRLTN